MNNFFMIYMSLIFFASLQAIGLSFVFQYVVAPALLSDNVSQLPKIGEYLQDAWTNGCDQDDTKLIEACSGNSGVYRIAGSALLFFLLSAIAAAIKPTYNRDAWPAKYTIFLILVGSSIFIPNDPLFDPILMNLARIGGVFFIIFQQLIILNMAYNFNESWVEKADNAEVEEGAGAGQKWFRALLFACAILFIGSFIAIGLMYAYFSDCPTNMAFITINLISGILYTVLQLFGTESSLFTSAAVFTYSTYLCFTAVSKNPNENCNPKVGEKDQFSIVLGICITLLSLSWTGWSLTAHKAVGADSDAIENSADGRMTKADEVKGVVIDKEKGEETELIEDKEGISQINARTFSNSWKLNLVLALVTCWFSMTLTGWGSIEASVSLENPDVSNVSMWMVISAQWLCIVLYVWSLVAPSLFPDRDFS